MPFPARKNRFFWPRFANVYFRLTHVRFFSETAVRNSVLIEARPRYRPGFFFSRSCSPGERSDPAGDGGDKTNRYSIRPAPPPDFTAVIRATTSVQGRRPFLQCFFGVRRRPPCPSAA